MTGGAAKRPDFALERAWAAELGGLAPARIAGVDEVGRGPLAGPVVAGAAVLTEIAADRLAEAGLDDSKRLGTRDKARLGALIDALHADGLLDLALGAASRNEIDRLNIRRAALLAMRRAVDRLAWAPDAALIDGRDPPALRQPTRAVIGGDRRSLSIAAAALAAKLARDRAMARLSLRWPGYGWDSNAGYPSQAHRAAIAALGATPHHRRSFNGCAHAPDRGRRRA